MPCRKHNLSAVLVWPAHGAPVFRRLELLCCPRCGGPLTDRDGIALRCPATSPTRRSADCPGSSPNPRPRSASGVRASTASSPASSRRPPATAPSLTRRRHPRLDAQPPQAARRRLQRPRAAHPRAAGTAGRRAPAAAASGAVLGTRHDAADGAGTRELLREPAPRLELGRGRERGGVSPRRRRARRRTARPHAAARRRRGAAGLRPARATPPGAARRRRPESRCSCSRRSGSLPASRSSSTSSRSRRATSRATRSCAGSRRPRRPAPDLHLVFADVTRAPFAAGAFDTVITPWLIDVLDEDLAVFARRVNGWLRPGGRWVNSGLAGLRRRGARASLRARGGPRDRRGSGFAPVEPTEEAIPYLCSPASRHGRIETVVTFATDEDGRGSTAAASAALTRLARKHRPARAAAPGARRAASSSCACSHTWHRWWTAVGRSATSRACSSSSA